jgi:hypothetical protein
MKNCQDLIFFREGETMQIFPPPLVGLFEKRERKEREKGELGS